MSVARFGPPHRMQSGSRCFPLRSHRPRHPRALAARRCLRLHPEQNRHLMDGLASLMIDPRADARHSSSLDLAILTAGGNAMRGESAEEARTDEDALLDPA